MCDNYNLFNFLWNANEKFKNTFQFGKMMDKLNIDKYCKPNSCQVKFKVVFHEQSNKSLVSDLMLKPSVNIGLGEGKKAFLVKSNLNLISSEEEPCSDDTFIGLDCTFKLVCPKLLHYYIQIFTHLSYQKCYSPIGRKFFCQSI